MTIQTRSYPGTMRKTTQQPSTGSTDTTAPMTRTSGGMAQAARALEVTDMDGRTWSLTMTAGRRWIHGRLGEAQASNKVCWRRNFLLQRHAARQLRFPGRDHTVSVEGSILWCRLDVRLQMLCRSYNHSQTASRPLRPNKDP